MNDNDPGVWHARQAEARRNIKLLEGATVDWRTVYQLARESGCDLAMAAYCVTHARWPVKANGDPLVPSLACSPA